jgi:hypothetical protein
VFRTQSRACFQIAAFAAFFLPQAIFGQQVYGSIYGTVTDPSGGGVPNAKVTITDQSKGARYEVTTNETGNYSKDRLIPGLYTVQVEGAGFRTAISRDIQVNVDQAARVDVTLQVGSVTEQVEVTAAAPLLQSDRADVATTLTAKQLEDLPNINRNFQSYELLLPGTSQLGWNHASSENPQGSIQIQVNGQHFSGTGFQLDGTDNQDPILGIIVINPNLDAVTETKISSQNYDAEFAYAGAGMMNVSTKSGTNDFHGSAFEYLQNNSPGFSTIARNPFNNDQLVHGVPPFKWNQFGGSIGGRIIKNKLFYFGDAQLTRRRFGSSVTTSVPTALARTGNFSEYLLPISGAPTVTDTTGRSISLQQNMIFDPLTGDPNTGVGRQAFPNNTIPASRLSPQAIALLKYLPLPNAPGQGQPFRNNFATSGVEKFDVNNWDTRIDYFINEKSSMFGRYSYQQFSKSALGAFDVTNATGGIFPGGPAFDNVNFAGLSDVKNQSLALGYTHTFSPTLITDVRFGYMRYRVNVLPNGLGTAPAKDLGIPNLNLDNFFTSGMPAFFINGDGGTNFGYSLGTNQCNCPLDQNERQFQFVDNTTKIIGNHSIKVGADIRYALQLRVPSDSHRAGELSFSPGYTGYVPSAGAGVQQGLGWATFLLGEATFFSRYVSSSTDAQERQKRFFWYVQDTWRVTPKLQLNYGVRWEMIFPEKVNAPGNGGQLDLRTGQIAVFGVGQVSDHGIQDMNWHNFAPRLGVTYQLTPKTVVRAGYGWSYELGTFGTLFGHNVTQNLPVLANQNLNAPNAFSGVFTLAQGPTSLTFPKPDATGRFPLPDGVNGKARPLTVILPRVMQWNATIQHQITKDFSLSAGYVGNRGRHVFNGDGPNFNVNQPAWVPGIADQNLRKPFYAKYGWTQGIDFYCNCATNSYDSLQIQGEKRYSFGYTATGSYTYQHAVNDSGDSYTFLYNRALGRGNTDFIAHNQFTLAQNFEIPFGKGRKFGASAHPAVNAILGGWMISGVTQFYTGIPFEPYVGNWPSGAQRPDVGPSGRPDIKSGGDPYAGAKHDRTQWFKGGLGDVFLVPANNQFGNMPRNWLFGPRFFNQDLSLAKAFQIKERARFQIRADAFNAFNHPNLGTPNNNITDPNAGLITSLANNAQMRRLQFGARLEW